MTAKKKRGCKRKVEGNNRYFLAISLFLAFTLIVGLSIKEDGLNLNKISLDSISLGNGITGAAIGLQSDIGVLGSGLGVGESPILNSSSLTNQTDENLTVYYYEGTGNKTIVNWYLNDTSITLLNVPFEADEISNVTDYANNAVGTVQGGTFNATGGYDSKGAFEFDGGTEAADQINFSDVNLNHLNYSIEVWAKFNDNTGQQPILSLNTPFTSDDLLIGVDNTDFNIGNITFAVYSASDWREASSTILPVVGEWYHIVVIHNDTNKSIYINGQWEGADANVATPAKTTLSIGKRKSSDINFNGTVDELKIYNHSLSAEQILALYNNRTDLIVSQETSLGQNWSACVTPNNGTEDSVEQCSNNLTIVAEPPVECGSVTSSITLTNNITVSGTCFTINQPNLVIDGNGYSITGDGTLYGLYLDTKTNITIFNLTIINFSDGIRALSSTDGSYYDNILINNSNNALVFSGTSISMENNTVFGSSTGISVLSGNVNCVVRNNSITGVSGRGIDVSNSCIVENNYINSSSDAIYIDGDNALVQNNYINTQSIGITVSSSYNNITNNTILASGDKGIRLMGGARTYNNISYNTINISSNDAGIGVDGSGSDHNLFISNEINTFTGSLSYGYYMFTGINNTIIGGTINTPTASDVYVYYGNVTLINATFNITDFTFADSGTISVKWYVDVNVTNSTGPLESVTITANNVSDATEQSSLTDANGFTTLTLTEFWQNGSLKINQTPHTINAFLISYSTNSTTINLTATNSTSANLTLTTLPGVTLTDCNNLTTPGETYTLDNDVSSNGTCFNILNNSITLDCAGHSINYSISGVSRAYGVNVTNYNNSVVQNCFIYEGNGTNSNSNAIYLFDSENHLVTNTTIVTLGTYARGVYGYWSSVNVSFSNISTFGSSYAPGILVDTDFGTFLNNTITTNGTNSNGIRLSYPTYSNLSGNIFNTTSANAIYLNHDTLGVRNNYIDNTNLQQGEQILFYFNQSDLVVEDLTDVGQIIVLDSINLTFTNISLDKNGFTFLFTNDSRVEESIINLSTQQVQMEYSNSNNFTNSVFEVGGSGYAVSLTTYSSENLFDNNSIFCSTSSGRAIYLSSTNNLFNNNFFNCSNSIVLTGHFNNFTNNIIEENGNDAVQIDANSNYFVNNTLIGSSVGRSFYIYPGGENNTFINNTLISDFFNPTYPYLFDASGSGTNNSLIYNNEFVEINWTKTNLTSHINLTIGGTVYLEDNLVGLIDDNNSLNLNGSAQIKFYGLNSTVHELYKDGVRCDHTDACNITLDAGGIVLADISSFSNYTTQESGAFIFTLTQPSNQEIDTNINATYIFTLTNNGITADNYTITLGNDDGASFAVTNVSNISDLTNNQNVSFSLIVGDPTSGTYNVTVNVTSFGNSSVIESASVLTIINEPSGNLSSEQILPLTNVNKTQNQTFTYTTQITCSNGACGNVSATLDPAPIVSSYPNESTTFEFIDINSSGTTLTQTDDDSDLVNIGFNFTFYNNTYDQVYVASNGHLVFGASSTNYNNVIIPTVDATNNFIAPFWDDLNPNGCSYINYETQGSSPNQNFIVQWNIPRISAGCGAPLNFEVVLSESTGNIQFNYLDVLSGGAGDNGSSATVGVENSTGSGGTLWSFNTASLTNNLSILYTGGGSAQKSGIVPNGSGDPFYTISGNPRNQTTDGCLADMADGENCNISWIVNSTGTIDVTHPFFVIFDSDYQNVTGINSSEINITISALSETGTTLTECTNLTTQGEIYTLANNVNSNGTCFNVLNHSITLDCAGYSINYSQAGTSSYGVNISGFDNVTIQNCDIREGNDTVIDLHSIYLNNAEECLVENNNIYITNTGSNYGGKGIRMDGSVSNSAIRNNNITGPGILSYGYGISNCLGNAGCNNNNFTGNIVIGKSSALYSSGTNDTVLNNTLGSVSVGSSALTLTGVNSRSEYNNITGGITISGENPLLIGNNVSASDIGIALRTTNATLYNNSFSTPNGSSIDIDTGGLDHIIGPDNLAEGLPIVYNYSTTNQIIFENVNLSETYGQVICANCNNVTYNNVTFGSDGLHFINTTNSSVSNSTFVTSLGEAVVGTRSLGLTITNNLINTTGDNGHGVYLLTTSNSTISDNQIYANGSRSDGIRLDTSSNLISVLGNIVTASGANNPSAVYAAPSTANLSVENNQLNGSYFALYFYFVSGSSVVNNNTMVSDGLYITFSSGVNISNNNISGGNSFQTSSNNIFTNNTQEGTFYIQSSDYNNFTSNTGVFGLEGGNDYNRFVSNNYSSGVSFREDSHNLFENNIIGTFSVSSGSPANNTFISNNFTGTISFSTNNENISNTLFFNNSFGSINWTSSNITTDLFPLVIGGAIIIENNTVGLVDNTSALTLNGSAQISFSGLNYAAQPWLLKNSVRCDNDTSLCNITSYDNTTGTLIAQVSSFSNYTTQEVTDSSPDVTSVSPATNYINDSAATTRINFSCNATDDLQLANISLYLTNSTNQSFALNQTTTITGTSNGTSWILNLSTGNYTWNCLAYDNISQSDWSDANRTILLNYTVVNSITFTLDLGDNSSFQLTGREVHTLTLNNATNTSAEITFQSTPTNYTLAIGVPELIDEDDSGYYDHSINLDEANQGNNATFTITSINTVVPTPETPATGGSGGVGGGSSLPLEEEPVIEEPVIEEIIEEKLVETPTEEVLDEQLPKPGLFGGAITTAFSGRNYWPYIIGFLAFAILIVTSLFLIDLVKRFRRREHHIYKEAIKPAPKIIHQYKEEVKPRINPFVEMRKSIVDWKNKQQTTKVVSKETKRKPIITSEPKSRINPFEEMRKSITEWKNKKKEETTYQEPVKENIVTLDKWKRKKDLKLQDQYNAVNQKLEQMFGNPESLYNPEIEKKLIGKYGIKELVLAKRLSAINARLHGYPGFKSRIKVQKNMALEKEKTIVSNELSQVERKLPKWRRIKRIIAPLITARNWILQRELENIGGRANPIVIKASKRNIELGKELDTINKELTNVGRVIPKTQTIIRKIKPLKDIQKKELDRELNNVSSLLSNSIKFPRLLLRKTYPKKKIKTAKQIAIERKAAAQVVRISNKLGKKMPKNQLQIIEEKLAKLEKELEE
jgi:hypothetical protein